MDFFRLPRIATGALAFSLAAAAMNASGQTPSTDNIALSALSSYAEAAQLFHLEESCPTLTTQERDEYRSNLSIAAGFLETMAPDAYRAAIANEQAIGSHLIPDRFSDCGDPAVAPAIRSGRAKAWTAVVLINQIPNNYRLPSSARQSPPTTSSPHELAAGAVTRFGVAYTIWHLEERCRVLPAAQRNEYAATIGEATPLLEAAAPDLFRAAVTSAQARGPALVPNVFPDCAHSDVIPAVEQGARDAQEALRLVRQLPLGYRMVITE
jgi:hypothetical protein